MTTEERMATIQERLQETFLPNTLEVIDDSAKHKGHVGSRDGAGHYTVIIAAKAFQNKSRIEIHRDIYKVLDDLIPKEIHALQIKVLQ
jgi:BolA family transcriptional regulator, general stress-responsive regulator